MKFSRANASVYYPESEFSSLNEAVAKTTHLAIGAHQDDIEIMAMHGIALCLNEPSLCFGAVTCTSGSGSARAGDYAQLSDSEMQDVRKIEQVRAAKMGKYSFMAQLGHPSSDVKNNSKETALHHDLLEILGNCQVDTIYTHNLMDKHDTHVAVAIKLIEALRKLPKDKRPKKLIGCEVWRGLDWILDSDKVQMDLDINDTFVLDMVQIFASQVEGGKRYDLATLGRMHANSTFSESHSVDQTNKRWYGIDLTPLIEDTSLSVVNFIENIQQHLYQDINQRILRYL